MVMTIDPVNLVLASVPSVMALGGRETLAFVGELETIPRTHEKVGKVTWHDDDCVQIEEDPPIPKAQQSLKISQARYLDRQIDFFNLVDAQRTLLCFGHHHPSQANVGG